MIPRERWLATAEFRAVDRAFLLPPWTWDETRTRWEAEGLPASTDLPRHFRTDREDEMPVAMQGKYGPHLLPALERTVLSQDSDHWVIRDEEGNTVKLFKNDPLQSMPQWIAYPMKNRADWEAIVKPRLDPHAPGRAPRGAELAAYAAQVQRHVPLGVWCGSMYGWPRSLMGVEQISYMFYDDPGLIHEMCEHITEFVITTLEPVLRAVPCDFAYFWEDMAGKAGPLCSPDTYREFMLPRIKRIVDFMHGHGVRHIIVDSDGNNEPLIPLWLEIGINGLRPFEIAAGCDPLATRKKYGRDLIIQGGIDKRALAAGRAAIDREVLSKVPWLCMQGGYFPQVDHLVPPDVPLENYTYYSDLLRQVVENPERFYYQVRQRGGAQ